MTAIYVTVGSGQLYPLNDINESIYYMKNESDCRYRNQCQIQICIPECLMSSEFFYDIFSSFGQI